MREVGADGLYEMAFKAATLGMLGDLGTRWAMQSVVVKDQSNLRSACIDAKPSG